jgi:hypothetical protein
LADNIGAEKFALDKLGQEVRVGDLVVAPESKTKLDVCRVLEVTPKMYRVQSITSDDSPCLKSHSQVISLNKIEAVVMYLMSQNL